jgi:hypothetical protein
VAADPIFYSTPVVGAGTVHATLDTSLTAPSNVTTILTGAATPGTKVEVISVSGLGTTVLGLVHIFIHDGSTYHLFDSFLIAAVTVSATVAPHRDWHAYDMLVLPTASYTLRVTNTIAGNQSLVKVIAHGGNA